MPTTAASTIAPTGFFDATREPENFFLLWDMPEKLRPYPIVCKRPSSKHRMPHPDSILLLLLLAPALFLRSLLFIHVSTSCAAFE